MKHDKLDMREVRPDEEVLHVLSDEQLEMFKRMDSALTMYNEAVDRIERLSNRYDALKTLFWDAMRDHIDREHFNNNVGMVVCSRGNDTVVVPTSNIDEEEEHSGCDCPVCQLKKKDAPPEILDLLKLLFRRGGDK